MRSTIRPARYNGEMNRRWGSFLALAVVVICTSRVAAPGPSPTASAYAPPATTPSPPSTARPLARFEPQDGQVYFGFNYWMEGMWDYEILEHRAAMGDTRPFPERIREDIKVELGGKTPSLFWVMGHWQRGVDCKLAPLDLVESRISRMHAAIGSSVVTVLEWMISGGSSAKDYRCMTTRDVASGAFDSYIRDYARAIKRWGQPMFVRAICGEMNGFWWQNCSPRANKTLTQEDFVSAWRRAVDIFRGEGANNVAWLWTPYAWPPNSSKIDVNLDSYWPGDDYVDWVGVDYYEDGPASWMYPIYTFALTHNKPVFVAEFGIRSKGSRLTSVEWRAWLEAMFDYFESHVKIKAITYFNQRQNLDYDPVNRVYIYDGQVSYHPDVNDNDYRLVAGGPEIRALFARRIANPRYISTVATKSGP